MALARPSFGQAVMPKSISCVCMEPNRILELIIS